MRRRLCLPLVVSLLAGLVLVGCDDEPFDRQSQIGPNPTLPEPQQYLLPAVRVARAIGWTTNETPTVSEGLRISAFATGLKHPRSLFTLPNGDVIVVEADGPGIEPIDRPKDLIMGWVMALAGGGGGGENANRLTLLRDADGDGVPEMKSVLREGLNSPFGVALIGQDLFVANTDAILRFRYAPGDTSITSAGTKLTDLPGGPIDHHWTKSLVANKDGTKLYVGVGSNSNIAENGLEAEKERAAIWEVDRESGAHRIFASGLRNPNGLSFEPASGRLWAVINERDELGPDLVPDYMTSVQDGAFYGWPYSYYGQHVDPRVMPQRPDLVAQAIPPDYALSSHVAPLGMVFSTGEALPEEFRNGAFVGEHGSWNRHGFNGYKVVFVPFKDGKPSGKARDVVTGFLNQNEEARGRPVGVTLAKDGALLIADDLGGTVWRVTKAN